VGSTVQDTQSQGLGEQFFDLLSLVILEGVPATAEGGAATTLGALMRKVWDSRPATRAGRDFDRANAVANEFSDAFNVNLPQLNALVADFLDEFDNHHLTVEFKRVALSWDKDTKLLEGATLALDVKFRGQQVSGHNELFNEARLSAVAICTFLAGVRLSDNDHANPAYPRFLVLDDALIGLELGNRLPILRILCRDEFKHYQIFLFTHDRVWFDLARGHLPESSGWVHLELIADESTGNLIPRPKPSQSDLARARTHLANGDLMAAAVYGRAAFEWKLRNVCQKRGIDIKFKTDPKEISADDLWKGILARQRKREELQNGMNPLAPDFIPNSLETKVETMRSTVLNQLAHSGSSGLVNADVRAALDTIQLLHNHNFPNLPANP
jgi:hypothetical protein